MIVFSAMNGARAVHQIIAIITYATNAQRAMAGECGSRRRLWKRI
jgi:hypothetical protein